MDEGIGGIYTLLIHIEQVSIQLCTHIEEVLHVLWFIITCWNVVKMQSCLNNFHWHFCIYWGGRGESDHMTQTIMNISVKRVSITNLITDRTIYRFYRGCKRVITPYVIIEYCYFKCRLVTCYRQPKWILVTWYKDKGPIECICHFSLNPKSRMTILQRYP